MIFNRWGEIVFEKKNLSINDQLGGWDGMYKGKKAKPMYIFTRSRSYAIMEKP
jgi:hypothetical protein